MLSIALPLDVVSRDEPVGEDEIEHEPGAFVRHCLDGRLEFRRDFEGSHELDGEAITGTGAFFWRRFN
jgi:hypothetical protein